MVGFDREPAPTALEPRRSWSSGTAREPPTASRPPPAAGRCWGRRRSWPRASNQPTHADIGGLSLAEGETVGIYYYSATYPVGRVAYTNGGPTLFSNDELELTSYRGIGTPRFGGSTFFPRQWNGTVHYEFGTANMQQLAIIDASLHYNSATELDRFEVAAGFELADDSDGIDPAGEEVTVEFGTFSQTLVPGSFTFEGPGWIYQASAPGITRMEILDDAVLIEGEGVDLGDTSNPVSLLLTLGDDAGETVTRLAGPLDLPKDPVAIGAPNERLAAQSPGSPLRVAVLDKASSAGVSYFLGANGNLVGHLFHSLLELRSPGSILNVSLDRLPRAPSTLDELRRAGATGQRGSGRRSGRLSARWFSTGAQTHRRHRQRDRATRPTRDCCGRRPRVPTVFSSSGITHRARDDQRIDGAGLHHRRFPAGRSDRIGDPATHSSSASPSVRMWSCSAPS